MKPRSAESSPRHGSVARQPREPWKRRWGRRLRSSHGQRHLLPQRRLRMWFLSVERPFLLTLGVLTLVLISELQGAVVPQGRGRRAIMPAAAQWSRLWAAERNREAERRPRPRSPVALGVPLAGRTSRPPQRFRRPLRHHVRFEPAHELRRVARRLQMDVAGRRERERFGVLQSALRCQRLLSWRP